jgi:hypothetical protein
MLKQCAIPLNYLKYPSKRVVAKYKSKEKKLKKVKKKGLRNPRTNKGIRLTKGGRRFAEHMQSVCGETEEELLEPYEAAAAMGMSGGNGEKGRRIKTKIVDGVGTGEKETGQVHQWITPNGELLVESDFGDGEEGMDEDEERSAAEEIILY